MNPYSSVFVTYIPAILILAGWFYYMLKTKSRISMLLFISSLLFLSISIYSILYNFTTDVSVDLREKIKTLSLLGNLNVLLHLAHAIIFVIFLINLLKPKTGQVAVSESNETLQ